MADTLTLTQLGMILGGAVVGASGGTFLLLRHFAKPGKKKENAGEHGGSVRRDEFAATLSVLQHRVDESHKVAGEARTVALATQTSIAAIGQLIESSVRSLGDRLEGALRDVKERVDDHAEEMTDHHGRLRAVETELQVRRER